MMKYVIAVRRGLRSQVGANWADSIKNVRGLVIVGDANPYRLRIEATERAIAIARRELEAFCHIEPVQQRYVLRG